MSFDSNLEVDQSFSYLCLLLVYVLPKRAWEEVVLEDSCEYIFNKIQLATTSPQLSVFSLLNRFLTLHRQQLQERPLNHQEVPDREGNVSAPTCVSHSLAFSGARP